jgi:hypothetical protein
MLFHAAVIKAAPVLCFMAVFMWSLQIATSFPPGAITVTAATRTTYANVTVPTLDANFVSFKLTAHLRPEYSYS